MADAPKPPAAFLVATWGIDSELATLQAEKNQLLEQLGLRQEELKPLAKPRARTPAPAPALAADSCANCVVLQRELARLRNELTEKKYQLQRLQHNVSELHRRYRLMADKQIQYQREKEILMRQLGRIIAKRQVATTLSKLNPKRKDA